MIGSQGAGGTANRINTTKTTRYVVAHFGHGDLVSVSPRAQDA